VVAAHRNENVDFIPTTPAEQEADLRIAQLAAILAIRRHLRMVGGQLGPKGAGILVLSGGVFRHADSLAETEKALRGNLGAILRDAKVVVDREGRLGPAGLLTQAGQLPTADALLRTLS